MTGRRPVSRNLWALIVLCLLRDRPRHPYEIRRVIRQRHKDQLLDLRPGSLYHAIDQLLRANLIEPVETARTGRRPEHTVYRLTEAGATETVLWLRELLERPAPEPSSFMAAIGSLAPLPSDDVRGSLERRARALEAEVAEGDAGAAATLAGQDPMLQRLGPRLARVVLLEHEYALAMRRAELAWVRALVDDLRSGRLHWRYQEFVDLLGDQRSAGSYDEPVQVSSSPGDVAAAGRG